MTAARIVIADDETNITDVCRRYLEREGYSVWVAANGEEALRLWREHQPDLLVLDLMMPKMDGIEVCDAIRQEADTPIIMLTARGEESDRLLGLTMGADDYMTKPFSPRELVLRVRNILRRIGSHGRSGQGVAGGIKQGYSALQSPSFPAEHAPASAKSNASSSNGTAGAEGAQAGERPNAELTGVFVPSLCLSFDGLTIYPDERRVVVREREVELTAKEFDMLQLLATYPGKVFSRNQLLNQVWDMAYEGDTTTVTVHVRRLREKVETNPSDPTWIKTVWGIGYKLDGKGTST
ncbi:response regulator transcription factor [Paenibacillus sp. HB172176]|uniref:response regulator transcription factor n=1 Tax=Paenibacillus sp. HB172176 TaxID=2493690 RepID=UPI001F0F8780|nr:response regulator transcription factor [Paenibacillus sp. HB172176]